MTNTRKHDDKALMKAAAEGNKDDKAKAKAELWDEIKESYLGVLIR